jgi:hypothetical protein
VGLTWVSWKRVDFTSRGRGRICPSVSLILPVSWESQLQHQILVQNSIQESRLRNKSHAHSPHRMDIIPQRGDARNSHSDNKGDGLLLSNRIEPSYIKTILACYSFLYTFRPLVVSVEADNQGDVNPVYAFLSLMDNNSTSKIKVELPGITGGYPSLPYP